LAVKYEAKSEVARRFRSFGTLGETKGMVITMEKNDIGWNLENSYSELPGLFYTQLKLATVSAPKLVILNQLLAKDIGLDSEALISQAGINILAGKALPANAKPIAQAYAGHQFGYFTMLGDGRAMLIGEQITPAGERFDIQLKGSGKTLFSKWRWSSGSRTDASRIYDQ